MVTGQRGPHRQRPEDAVIRVSVTDRCNLRCRYCMPAAGIGKLRREDLLPLERLADTVAWLSREFDVSRVKLTGGEPLLRDGVVGLVQSLAAIPGVSEVSATTNGARLVDLAPSLRGAGLSRVNVSVDSLDERRFAELTRGGRLADTLAGIGAALDCGLTPVKMNAVLLSSNWRSDVPLLLDFAGRQGLEIRFIELMRTGTEVAWAEREYVSADEVRWITPRSRPFCDSCSRLRLDARGRVRRCLMDPVRFDLAGLLETTIEPEVRSRLHAYLAGKTASSAMESDLPMVSMGG
jgi:cyclic pyranopterin phosphate synthase